VWSWRWCSRWAACRFSLHAPSCGFSSQEVCVLILKDKSAGRICLFAPEQQQTPFFLTWNAWLLFMSRLAVERIDWRPFPCKPWIQPGFQPFPSWLNVEVIDVIDCSILQGARLRYPPHHVFKSGWHYLQHSHAGAFWGAGSWFSKS